MSTALEIEDAIRSLSSEERQKLVKDLPSLLPELDGDAAWERIIRDKSPRPSLTAFANQAVAEYKANPAACPDLNDTNFDLHS